jgi:hypothetical protein
VFTAISVVEADMLLDFLKAFLKAFKEILTEEIPDGSPKPTGAEGSSTAPTHVSIPPKASLF